MRPTTNSTDRRVPRTIGLPTSTAGSRTIRSCILAATMLLTRAAPARKYREQAALRVKRERARSSAISGLLQPDGVARRAREVGVGGDRRVLLPDELLH